MNENLLMDTQNLKAFQAVAESHSFSEAANELFITQPAVSKRIAALELELGCKLFDRVGRSVHLTHEGSTLLPKAQQILRDLQDTRRLMAELSGEVKGHLSLATSHHIGLHRLPSVLRQFTQTYPSVQLSLDFLDSEKTYAQVIQGRYDIAITTLAPEAEKAIRVHPIWTDELCVVAAHDHPLSKLPQLSLNTLTQFPAILPDQKSYTTQLIRALFDRENLTLTSNMATNHMDTIKMMSSIGLGWAVLPKTIMGEDLCTLNVKGVKLSRELGLIHHSERSLSNAAKAFLDLLQKAP